MRARPSLFVSLSLITAVALLPATGMAKKKKAEAAPAGPTVLEAVTEGQPYKSWAAFQPAADAAMKNEGDPSALAVLFVQAMVARTYDKTLGEAMMGYVVWDDPRSSYRIKDDGSESGFRINKVFQEELAEPDRKPRILFAYCGGTPSGNYRDHDFANCTPTIASDYSARMQGPKSGRAKYFLNNEGASRPRPITLKQTEDGLWRVYTVSGLMTGVAATAEESAARADD